MKRRSDIEKRIKALEARIQNRKVEACPCRQQWPRGFDFTPMSDTDLERVDELCKKARLEHQTRCADCGEHYLGKDLGRLSPDEQGELTALWASVGADLAGGGRPW